MDTTSWADGDLDRARRTADAHIAAVRALERFVTGLRDVPRAVEIVEFTTLSAREEAARADRIDAFAALGLTAASVE
jgi:hypothetical protein